jgi:uncharacterized membrane protein
MSNYHLLIVHFPIVFAIMYGLVEVVSFFRKNQSPFLHHVAGWITLFGTASILVAQQTGEMIEHAGEWSVQQHKMIEVHSGLSNVLLTIFIIALAGYVIDFLLTNKEKYFSRLPEKVFPILIWLQKIVSSKTLRFFLGMGSVGVVSVLGALGGAVAFGCSVDPLASFLCTFF